MLGISFRDHVTNEYVKNLVNYAAGPQETLLVMVFTMDFG